MYTDNCDQEVYQINVFCAISGFRRTMNEIFALLRCYPAFVGQLPVNAA